MMTHKNTNIFMDFMFPIIKYWKDGSSAVDLLICNFVENDYFFECSREEQIFLESINNESWTLTKNCWTSKKTLEVTTESNKKWTSEIIDYVKKCVGKSQCGHPLLGFPDGRMDLFEKDKNIISQEIIPEVLEMWQKNAIREFKQECKQFKKFFTENGSHNPEFCKPAGTIQLKQQNVINMYWIFNCIGEQPEEATNSNNSTSWDFQNIVWVPLSDFMNQGSLAFQSLCHIADEKTVADVVQKLLLHYREFKILAHKINCCKNVYCVGSGSPTLVSIRSNTPPYPYRRVLASFVESLELNNRSGKFAVERLDTCTMDTASVANCKIRWPFLPCGSGDTLWSVVKQNNFLKAQKYLGGVLGFAVRLAKDIDPHYYRIITTTNYLEVAVATTEADLIKLFSWLETSVLPKLEGLTFQEKVQYLPVAIAVSQRQYVCAAVPALKNEQKLRQENPFLFCTYCGRLAQNPVKILDENITEPRYELTDTYCKTCAIPNSLKDDDWSDFQESKEIEALQKSVEYCCTFSENGCDFSGKLEDVTAHVGSCTHSHYFCPNAKFGCNFSHKNMSEVYTHINSCKCELQQHFPRTDSIPDDILSVGALLLQNISDVVSLSQVSKRANKILQNDEIWQHFFMKDFGVDEYSSNKFEGWKMLYIENYKIRHAPCKRCGSRDKNRVEYHRGTWRGLTYEQVLKNKNTTDFKLLQVETGARIVAMTPAAAIGGVLGAGSGLVTGTISKAAHLFDSGHGRLSFFKDNFVTGVFLGNVCLINFFPPLAAVTVPLGIVLLTGYVGVHGIVGSVKGAVAGAKKGAALFEGKGSGVWTCCGKFGSWSKPCASCDHQIKS